LSASTWPGGSDCGLPPADRDRFGGRVPVRSCGGWRGNEGAVSRESRPRPAQNPSRARAPSRRFREKIALSIGYNCYRVNRPLSLSKRRLDIRAPYTCRKRGGACPWWGKGLDFPTRFPTELLTTGWEQIGRTVGRKFQKPLFCRTKQYEDIQDGMTRNGLGNRCSIRPTRRPAPPPPMGRGGHPPRGDADSGSIATRRRLSQRDGQTSRKQFVRCFHIASMAMLRGSRAFASTKIF